MTYKLTVNSRNPPIDALIIAELINSQKKEIIKVIWSNDWKGDGNVRLTDNQNKLLGERNSDVGRYFGRTTHTDLYGGTDPRERTEVDHWISFAIGPLGTSQLQKSALSYLDNALITSTWLVSKKLTLADIYVFSTLLDKEFLSQFEKDFVNASRWYKQILSLPTVAEVLSSIKKNANTAVRDNVQSEKTVGKQMGTRKQEGKFIELPGAEMGKVVVRFPPEASGYLHIGHAKAALLNQYYAEAFQGQLIMRFDDTNPAKENVEFEKAILEDLELLQIKPDRFTHSSDYFDLMLEYCTKMIKEGKAYVDDTPALVMKEQREQKLMSSNRDNPVEKNLKLWDEMKLGTPKGQECCVRAKIDYQSTNGCLRDPTIYRCKPEPHPRTGIKYKVYPTYDFACPIVDAIENVTHTLRTTEYHDRDAQFYWLIENLGLRRPYIWEYSRLNMTNTVLSKRKLTWFVDEGLVDGWDDPRFPTVRGILRRGMTVEGLKQFIIAQGSSRSVVFMEWDKIWAFNKKVIDPIATRYTALDHDKLVSVCISDAKEEWLTVQNHPKDLSKGTKRVLTSSLVYIERDDANMLVEGQNATFINWGNILIEKIEKDKNGVVKKVTGKLNLENKDYKNTLKITWLATRSKSSDNNIDEASSIPCYAVHFDHIINKPVLGKDDDYKHFVAKNTRTEVQMLGEAELKRVKKGEIIQLQRKGFFRCDVPYSLPSEFSSREQPLILFHVPDGHTTNTAKPATAPPSVQKPVQKDDATQDTNVINEKIVAQGDKVRNLKAKKADKATIDAEVKVLLNLKAEYKTRTGVEWKPGLVSAKSLEKVPNNSDKDKLYKDIAQQESKINELQRKINEEMQRLTSLKTEYRSKTGADWTNKGNENVTENKSSAQSSVDKLLDDIQKQGDKVRQLKSSKAEKSVVDAEVKKLLALKSDYKSATGQEWKPSTTVSQKPVTMTNDASKEESNADQLSMNVQQQGDKVRQLKASKAEKNIIDAEVKKLLALKSDYKTATGQEWKPSTTVPQKPVTMTNDASKEESNADQLSMNIQQQGDKVRQLKASKAEKSVIDAEVKKLLALKSDYKSATGQEWKPSTTVSQKPVTTTNDASKEESNADQLSMNVQQQGDKVRQLKASKAEKSVIDAEVKKLLALKSDYKSATGQEWKPSTTVSQKPVTTTSDANKEESNADQLSMNIQQQGDKVRQLKASKAEKSVIDAEVKKLLALKSDYKSATGQEWKPSTTVPQKPVTTINDANKEESNADQLSMNVQQQGDKVRQLKESKAEKSIIDAEVKKLLALKSDYKSATGQEWKPSTTVSQKPVTTTSDANKEESNADQLSMNVQQQGDKVRQLKESKAEKSAIDAEVKILLDLKSSYKTLTGQEWKSTQSDSTSKKKKKEDAPKTEKQANACNKEMVKSEGPKDADTGKTGTRLGLEAKKEENFFEWYSQIITKSGMIEYYDVSGCYVLRPWSFAVWKIVKEYIDKEITKLGVQECYFPIFVTRAVLEKEKSHITDFAPEVAWVTKCGESDLAEPIAIRPTSETVMYPAYAKWLRSDTELPLKLNQWNNVVRWEFKDPKPFLRTREFLWQEGHSAFATKAEADEEVLVILDIYARVYEDLLAVPVIKGRKTEKEKFAGGDYTTTVEAFISTSGRAIQGATSHHLGQNFSKMFNIQVEGTSEGDEKTFVYQNSWGLTTRTIGVMIMVHGDDKGLVLPPNVASIQAVIVPCGIAASTSSQEREALFAECDKLLTELSKEETLRVKADYRSNRTPGWKFNHWELKGVPVRVELGPKDMKKNQVTFVRRDTSTRITADRCDAVSALRALLAEIQSNMLSRARENLNDHIKQVEKWNDFCVELNKKNLLLSPFCGEPSCEDNIKADSAREDTGEEPGTLSMGAKSLCIPFEQPTSTPIDKQKCLHPSCSNKPKFYTLFGRSY